MSRIPLCRVCLASNIRMYTIARTRDQGIFEKLAAKLHTDDRRPETLCYVCYSQLQRCRKFMEMSRKAEEILTQFTQSGIELTEGTVSILDIKLVNKITWTPLQFLCINDVTDHNINQVKTEIKIEPSKESEPVNVKIEPLNEFNINRNQLTEVVSERETSTQCFSKKEIIKHGEKHMEYDVNITEEYTESVSEREILTGYVNKRENPTEYSIESENTQYDSKANSEECQGNTLPEILTVKEEFVSDDERFTEEPLKHEDKVTAKKEIISESGRKQELGDFKDVNFNQKESTSDQTDRQRYTCDHCSKSYLIKSHLQRHMKFHRVVNGVPTKSYNCKICAKSFIEKYTLKRHVQVHTDDKKLYCDICPTRCRHKHDMERHMLTHTGQKPFTCPVCKRNFTRNSNMKLHILTHDDKKPFVCGMCKATFSRKYDLNRHNKRKHLREKPFKCEICDFRSVNASYIKKHMDNIHVNQGVPRFSCDICKFKCCQEGYLKIHKQKKHSDKTKPLVLKIKKE